MRNPFQRKSQRQKYTIMVLDKQTDKIEDLYEFGKKLGEGAFGICRLGTHKKTGQQVAIKTISKGKIITDAEANDIRNEILIMEAVADHENIVKIFGAFEDVDNVHIVLELCSGGDLFDSIIAKGRYSEKDCADLCRQMLNVLDHCHKKGIIHRDLKPENFLLDSSETNANLKATDFGLSCFFQLPGDLKEPCGTPMYIAPEVIRGKYSHKADVWSAGVVLYILLSGKVPFYGNSDEEILRSTLRGKFNMTKEPWPHISDDAKECVRLMLTTDPDQRPDAAEMLDHPWMKEDGTASSTPLAAEVLEGIKEFHEMNKFKARAVQIMATNMSEDDLAKIRKAFDEVDTDKSGTITMQEMKAAIAKLDSQIAEGELMKMWQTFDIDGNGTMDYEEFLALTSDVNKLNTHDNFRYAFKQFDKDGDGSITADEVMEALKNSGIDAATAKTLVKEADLNNDGVIDYEEFVYMMTKKEKTDEAASKVRKKNLEAIAGKALAH